MHSLSLTSLRMFLLIIPKSPIIDRYMYLLTNGLGSLWLILVEKVRSKRSVSMI